jgi:hypothetical protein
MCVAYVGSNEKPEDLKAELAATQAQLVIAKEALENISNLNHLDADCHCYDDYACGVKFADAALSKLEGKE